MRLRTALLLYMIGLALLIFALLVLAAWGVERFVLIAGGICLAAAMLGLYTWLLRRLLTPLDMVCTNLQKIMTNNYAVLKETRVMFELEEKGYEWRHLTSQLNACLDAARAMFESLRDKETMLQSLTDNIPHGVYRCLCDQGWTILYLSQGIEKLSGYPLDHFFSSEKQKKFQHLILPEDEPHVRRSMAYASSFEIEYRIVRADGSIRWVSDYGRIVEDESGEACWMDGVLLDITEERLAKDTLRQMHCHDSMTGLYSRAFFEEELNRLQSGSFDPVSVIICDVDCLKLINDKLGHESGDTLLKTAASLVRSSLRKNDFVARTGGDEITILLPACSPEVAQTVADKISETIRMYNSSDSGIPVALSLGIATENLRDTPAAQLVSLADTRMFLDKKNHHACSRVLMTEWVRHLGKGFVPEEKPEERLY